MSEVLILGLLLAAWMLLGALTLRDAELYIASNKIDPFVANFRQVMSRSDQISATKPVSGRGGDNDTMPAIITGAEWPTIAPSHQRNGLPEDVYGRYRSLASDLGQLRKELANSPYWAAGQGYINDSDRSASSAPRQSKSIRRSSKAI